MSNVHIRRGDNVIVLTGKDRKSTGKVLACDPDSGRATVEGVNIVKKHTKPKGQGKAGGIVKTPGAVHTSNLMVICPSCDKPTRVAHQVIDGKKARVCKKCGASLDAGLKADKKGKAADKAKKAKKDAPKKEAAKKESTAKAKKELEEEAVNG